MPPLPPAAGIGLITTLMFIDALIALLLPVLRLTIEMPVTF
jgi:hypothetical protein